MFSERAKIAFGGRVARSESDERSTPLDYSRPDLNRRDSVAETHDVPGACRRAVSIEKNQFSTSNAIAWLFWFICFLIHRVAED